MEDSQDNFLVYTTHEIRMMEPFLKFFGLDYHIVCSELTDVMLKRMEKGFIDEDENILEDCKNANGTYDSAKFGLMTEDVIYIQLPESFDKSKFSYFYEGNLRKYLKENEYKTYYRFLLLLTVAYYRNSKIEIEIERPEDYDIQINWEYTHIVRPNMLKLYIALNEPIQKENTKEHQITIRVDDNSPVHLDDSNFWLTTHLNNYLDKFLGVKSVQEAQRELDCVYNKKIGSKGNPQLVRYAFGLFQLFKGTKLQPNENRTVTAAMSLFIVRYLEFIGMIKFGKSNNPEKIEKDLNDNEKERARQIRSTINGLLLKGYTIEDILDYRNYKPMPDNLNSDAWMH